MFKSTYRKSFALVSLFYGCHPINTFPQRNVRSQIVRYIVRCVFLKDYRLSTFVELGIVQSPKCNSVVKAYSHLSFKHRQSIHRKLRFSVEVSQDKM